MAKVSYTITPICGAGGFITPSGPQVLTKDDEVDFHFIPDEGYAVQDVFIDGRQIALSDCYSPSYPQKGYHYGFAQVKRDRTIRVTFSPVGQYELWLVMPPVANNVATGMLFKTPDAPKYVYNAHVVVKAVPATGYHFAGWTGDMTGIENPITVVVTKDMKISADFAEGYPEVILIPIPIEDRVTNIEERLTKAGL
jgi:uncharacterized repeat protein (TIGR02543 family)